MTNEERARKLREAILYDLCDRRGCPDDIERGRDWEDARTVIDNLIVAQFTEVEVAGVERALINTDISALPQFKAIQTKLAIVEDGRNEWETECRAGRERIAALEAQVEKGRLLLAAVQKHKWSGKTTGWQEILEAGMAFEEATP